MRNRLLVLGRFAHDPQSVLTAVHRLALVCVELLLNSGFIGRAERSHGGKLHVAVFADAELWGFAHDPKFSLCHTLSLRRSHRSTPVEIKRHHYRNFGSVLICPYHAPRAASDVLRIHFETFCLLAFAALL